MCRPDRLRVMVVENEKGLLDILQEYFDAQEETLCCATATTGREALELIYSVVPDVLLLDLVLPCPDGLSILEHLRANPPAGRRPRVLVISAFDKSSIATEARNLGADYFVGKPFQLADLLRCVKMLGSQEPETESRAPLQSQIQNLLLEAGSDARKLGHGYLASAVEQLIAGGPSQYINAIFKGIAQEMHTSEDAVSEAVRRDIADMSQRRTPVFRSLGLEEMEGAVPSPRKFLVAFAARVQELRLDVSKGGRP